MFVPGELEAMTYARQRELEDELAQRQLINLVQGQRKSERLQVQVEVIHWLGVQLIRWGLKLQGEQLPLAGTMVVADEAGGRLGSSCC